MKIRMDEKKKGFFAQYGACIELYDTEKTYRVRFDKRGDSFLFPLPDNSNFLCVSEKEKKVEKLFLK
jgi:hypothetical protein